MLLVPAELIDDAGLDSHSIIDGEAYAQFSLSMGGSRSIPLANGGLLTAGLSADRWSLNVRSSSGNQQSVELIPGENGSYELKYMNGGTVSGSLVVAPMPNSGILYTTFDGAGVKIKEEIFAAGQLSISYPSCATAGQGPPLTNALTLPRSSAVVDVGAPPISMLTETSESVHGDAEVETGKQIQHGHKVITFLTKLNKSCCTDSSSTQGLPKYSERSGAQQASLSKLTSILRQAASSRPQTRS